MELSRCKLFTGLAALIAAPTIARVASIMHIRPVELWEPLPEYVRGLPGMSSSEMVTQTLCDHRTGLADNVMKHNALLCRLTETGLIINV